MTSWMGVVARRAANVEMRRAKTLFAKAGVCLCIGVLGSSCAGTPEGESEPKMGSSTVDRHVGTDPALALLPVDALGEDLLLQQHVLVKWQDGEEGFDAVLQKRGVTLLLIGLGPMNTVGFRLTLDEGGLSFENRSGRELPFQPERIISDVQRVFYPWLKERGRCVNCERSEVFDGLEVRERYGPRFLEARVFQWVATPERGQIEVLYEDWTIDSSIPRRATLSNGWFGYQLIIETNRVERID